MALRDREEDFALLRPRQPSIVENSHLRTIPNPPLQSTLNDVHEIYTIKYSHIYVFSLTFMFFCD